MNEKRQLINKNYPVLICWSYRNVSVVVLHHEVTYLKKTVKFYPA